MAEVRTDMRDINSEYVAPSPLAFVAVQSLHIPMYLIDLAYRVNMKSVSQ